MSDRVLGVPELPGERSLLTRAQIAQAAGVKEQAVSNWVHRHPGFPRPIQGDQQIMFPAGEVAAWLDRRKIQKCDLREGEVPGVTYGQRFRRVTGLRTVVPHAVSAAPTSVTQLKRSLWRRLESGYKQSADPSMFEELVMSLLCVQVLNPAGWASIVAASRQGISVVFYHVWYALPIASSMRTELTLKIRQDGWWRDRLSTITDALRDHVQPGGASPPATTARRLTPVEAFDFLLDRFAQARHSSNDEYLTPAGVAGLMVRLAAPGPADRVHNPCCGSGEILTAVLAHRQRSGPGRVRPGRVSGRALAARTWRLATMNAAVHGGSIDLGDQPPENPTMIDVGVGPYDVIVTNPPFKMDTWQPPAGFQPTTWPYGEPPRHNVNFAWLQLAVTALAPAGRAVVVLPHTAASSQNPKDRHIRAAMVKQGVVRCVIELPGRLFRETASPITLWVLGRPDERPHHRVLLVDGKEATEPDGVTHRVLTDVSSDIIVGLYQEWLADGDGPPQRAGNVIATSVTLERLEQNGFDLRAAAYLRPSTPDAAPPPQAMTLVDLRKDLRSRDIAAVEADHALDLYLDRLAPWNR